MLQKPLPVHASKCISHTKRTFKSSTTLCQNSDEVSNPKKKCKINVLAAFKQLKKDKNSLKKQNQLLQKTNNHLVNFINQMINVINSDSTVHHKINLLRAADYDGSSISSAHNNHNNTHKPSENNINNLSQTSIQTMNTNTNIHNIHNINMMNKSNKDSNSGIATLQSLISSDDEESNKDSNSGIATSQSLISSAHEESNPLAVNDIILQEKTKPNVNNTQTNNTTNNKQQMIPRQSKVPNVKSEPIIQRKHDTHIVYSSYPRTRKATAVRTQNRQQRQNSYKGYRKHTNSDDIEIVVIDE